MIKEKPVNIFSHKLIREIISNIWNNFINIAPNTVYVLRQNIMSQNVRFRIHLATRLPQHIKDVSNFFWTERASKKKKKKDFPSIVSKHTSAFLSLLLGSCLKTGQHSIFVIIRKIKNWYTYVGYRKMMILCTLWSNIFIIRIIIIIIGNKKIKQYLGYGIKNYTFYGQ